MNLFFKHPKFQTEEIIVGNDEDRNEVGDFGDDVEEFDDEF